MLTKKRRNLIFLEAGILTLLVYIFALFFNFYLDDLRINDIEDKISKSEIFLDPFSSGDYFFNLILSEDCENSRLFLNERHSEIKSVGISLRDYGGLFSEINFNQRENIERKYYLDQLQMYEWVDRYNSACINESKKPIVPVIYFFDGLSSDFDRQSILLEQYSFNQENETIIFSFDYYFNSEPILDMIKNEYQVSSPPFVIIGNKTTRNLGDNNNIISINALTVEFMRIRGELND